jgi:hypothetical protein
MILALSESVHRGSPRGVPARIMGGRMPSGGLTARVVDKLASCRRSGRVVPRRPASVESSDTGTEVSQNQATTIIGCPTCGGPVDFDGVAIAICLIGHQVAADDLPVVIEAATSRASWAAVRALEDATSGARWQQSLPEPPRWLPELQVIAESDAVLLRELLDRREGSGVNATSRPEGW